LIDQQLLLSKGKELGITGETELIKRLDEIRKQNHLDSMEDLEKAYASQAQGGTFEDFKATIRNSIITQQVVRDEVGRRISMSPGEVQQYFKQHESEFAQPESVTLNEILIPTPAKSATEGADDAQVAAAQAQADEIEKKLAAGAKFGDLAKPDPTDPNAPKSVTLGEFHRDQLAKEIADKAFALNAGQHTQPIRTKQGFIILQATQHNLGGDASFQQVEPQVEEAIFLERMQPKLREYLTKLREEAAIDIYHGTDTGASGNEMHLTYSAYTPPPPKKKKKFARTRFRGRAPVQTAKTAPAAPVAAPAAPAGATAASGTAAPAAAPAGSTATTAASAPPSAAKPAATQQASNTVEKPGKKEKIRFGQAPRESLPQSTQVATANAPDSSPSVTTPETRYVNPDGTVSGAVSDVPEKKTRLSSRPVVHKAKASKSKSDDATDQPTTDDLATQKVQNAPLDLSDPNAKKPKPKGEKSRLSDKPKEPDQTPAPYLGHPDQNPPQAAPAASQNPVPGAPAAGPQGNP
ncbi:MAG TPA: peptidyl-prolyl cis-trans isomerase, partial [Acidobacteriaceae bacterium]|nr:peptidyl-prolyl cis-trans isomerase [Acidobacteriaceae bacterium]